VRWATFDCYGTLVDWNAGIGRELERLLGPSHLARYHELEPEIQAAQPAAPYREVLATTLARLADEAGRELPDEERDALARSLPDWPMFSEVPAALAELRERGWRTAILSNTDRDLIEASMARIGVPFELAIVASEIGSYKPAHGHWSAFFEATGADRGRHVHVGASVFHDIAPASELGLTPVWINRLGEASDRRAAVELPDLAPLPDALDELVPAD
jgi:2-haloacid dehalogenase